MKALRRLLQHSLARRMLLVQLATSMAMYLAGSCVIVMVVLHDVDRDASRTLNNYAHTLLEVRDPALTTDRMIQDARNLQGSRFTDPREMLHFRLLDGDGKVLAQSNDPTIEQKGWRRLRLDDPQSGRVVLVAINESWLRKVWLFGGASVIFWLGLVMAALLPLIVLATVVLTRIGLRPLSHLVESIGTRSPGNLVPVQIGQAPVELQPLIAELNRLIEALQQAQLQERKFFQDAAHELLTPLSAIQAQAHVLSSAEDQETRQRAKLDLHAGLQRAAKMIRQLLTVARLQSIDTSLQLVENDLVQLLADRISAVAARAHEKRVELSLLAPTSCRLSCDYDMLTIVVDNLLDNGIKYVPAGGRIAVVLRRYRDAMWLIVADNGPGIPQDLRQRVFERFYRVPSNSEPGSGLGLAIVQRIAEMHTGIVELLPNKPQGLMVCLRLVASHEEIESSRRVPSATRAREFDLGAFSYVY